MSEIKVGDHVRQGLDNDGMVKAWLTIDGVAIRNKIIVRLFNSRVRERWVIWDIGDTILLPRFEKKYTFPEPIRFEDYSHIERGEWIALELHADRYKVDFPQLSDDFSVEDRNESDRQYADAIRKMDEIFLKDLEVAFTRERIRINISEEMFENMIWRMYNDLVDKYDDYRSQLVASLTGFFFDFQDMRFEDKP
jgi:hypothetical protein